eukprot:jgi/Astpho2/7821/Aster-06110
MAELMRMSQGSHLTRHSSIKEHPAPDLEHTFTSAHLQNASSRQSSGSTNGMHTIPEAFGSGGAGSSSASQSWR